MGRQRNEGENKSKPFNLDDKHGRVGRLDEQTMGYYRRISDTLEGGFGSNEEKELFMNNVFEQLCQEAITVSQNQTASRIVEVLVRHADRSQLRSFMNALAKDWETACTDRFACYVTQSLIVATASYIADEEPEDEDSSGLKSINKLLSEVCGFLAGNLAFHMQNTYASHILRVLIEVTGGVTVSEKVIRSKLSRQQKDDGKGEGEKRGQRKATERSLQLFYSLCQKILSLKKLEDHARNNLANPILQTVILALKAQHPAKCAEACRTLIECTQMFVAPAGDESKIPVLVSHEIGSHFVEQIVSAAPEELYGEMLEKHFAQHLQNMALHPVANFVLQRIITEAHTCEQFQTIYHLVASVLEDILARVHMGVILRLAEGASKHGTKQKKLVKALMKAFHCYSPPERQLKCVQLFASLTTYEVFYKVREEDKDQKASSSDEDSDSNDIVIPTLTRVNLHGSILLQNLLRFGNPKLVVTSLLQMRSVELKTLSCDQCGSHVIDAFMKSATVGEKSREKIYVKLKPFLLELACSKSGSRSLDTLWHAASVKQKAVIAEQLVKNEARVRGDKFGRFAWRNYALEAFVHRRPQWQQIQTGETKKRRMFGKIIVAEGQPEKKKHKAKDAKLKTQGHAKLQQEDSSSDDEEKSSGQLKQVSPDSVTPVETPADSSEQKVSKKHKLNSGSIENGEKSDKKKKKKKKNVDDNVDIQKEERMDKEVVYKKKKKNQTDDTEETPKTKKVKLSEKKKKKKKAVEL